VNSVFIRATFMAAGLLQLALAVGFATRMDWATALWPWADGRLSHIFIGSVLAAFSAGALWVGWTGRFRAAGPSLVGMAGMFAAMGLFLAGGALSGEIAGAGPHAAAFLASAFGAMALLAAAGGDSQTRAPLMPIVRWSCGLFAAALLLAGLALVARMQTVFPWPLAPQSSTMFGIAFVGLSVVYGLTASNGLRDQGIVVMAGFFAYDLVLLPPFLAHFATVAPELLPSLSVYVAVLFYSAGLAIYFLVREARRPSRA
jgi:hypothetical protein